jgi:hypothetical protein
MHSPVACSATTWLPVEKLDQTTTRLFHHRDTEHTEDWHTASNVSPLCARCLCGSSCCDVTLVSCQPELDPRLIKRSRIKPHDLRVAENAQQRRNIVRGHPAQGGGGDCQIFHRDILTRPHSRRKRDHERHSAKLRSTSRTCHALKRWQDHSFLTRFIFHITRNLDGRCVDRKL